jgi:Domain of unknown function (DUF4272)
VRAETVAQDPHDDELAEDELEIVLRPVPEIAHRLLILAAIAEHLSFTDADGSHADELAGNTFDLREWLRTEGIWPDLMQDEVLLLAAGTPPGEEPDQFSVQETLEAFGALAWALNLVPILEADSPASVDTLIPSLPHPWDSIQTWVEGLDLRSLDEIAAKREGAELWTWRLLVENDFREAFGSEQAELREVIREAEREGRAAGILPRSGFRVQGRDISTLNLTERNTLLAASLARLRAFNWVCGYGARWDDVPLDI